MSFAASVAALRTLFGVPDDAPLLEAIQVMNISMGLAADQPSPEALAFVKGASPADSLVDRSLLFKWPVVGWCVGKILSRNTDARKTAKLADGSTAKKKLQHRRGDLPTGGRAGARIVSMVISP